MFFSFVILPRLYNYSSEKPCFLVFGEKIEAGHNASRTVRCQNNLIKLTHQRLRQLKSESKGIELGSLDPHVLGHDVAPEAEGDEV